jgi:aryl-alcohol dehydrogenase-like predicted oxidoreductase
LQLPVLMRPRPFGQTGLFVSPLGLGAGPLGDHRLTDTEAVCLVHAAIDRGVTLIDTAPSYGASEERLGRALAGSHRRRVVLSTKLGYGVPGLPDWTGPCVAAGIDLALRRLATDVLDVAHLHSCPTEVLGRDDILAALDDAVRAGKLRVAAYSGDGAPLAAAISSGRFASVQASVNLVDQRALDLHLPAARAAGLGVIAKRPLLNGAFRHAVRPAADDVGGYWDRLARLAVPDDGRDPAERALRFVLAQPDVDSAIAGTTTMAHLDALCAWAERGPLPADEVAAWRAAFRREDRGAAWDGVV